MAAVEGGDACDSKVVNRPRRRRGCKKALAAAVDPEPTASVDMWLQPTVSIAQPRSWLELPDVIHIVFTYLPPTELGMVARVSRRFRTMSSSDRLWRDIVQRGLVRWRQKTGRAARRARLKNESLDLALADTNKHCKQEYVRFSLALADIVDALRRELTEPKRVGDYPGKAIPQTYAMCNEFPVLLRVVTKAEDVSDANAHRALRAYLQKRVFLKTAASAAVVLAFGAVDTGTDTSTPWIFEWVPWQVSALWCCEVIVPAMVIWLGNPRIQAPGRVFDTSGPQHYIATGFAARTAQQRSRMYVTGVWDAVHDGVSVLVFAPAVFQVAAWFGSILAVVPPAAIAVCWTCAAFACVALASRHRHPMRSFAATATMTVLGALVSSALVGLVVDCVASWPWVGWVVTQVAWRASVVAVAAVVGGNVQTSPIALACMFPWSVKHYVPFVLAAPFTAAREYVARPNGDRTWLLWKVLKGHRPTNEAVKALANGVCCAVAVRFGTLPALTLRCGFSVLWTYYG